ncbi:hypothetical protein N665_0137s0070 [Sinapis alba]|nr:hypothetical protein N665_0137s0070 [Sinapis alba]
MEWSNGRERRKGRAVDSVRARLALSLIYTFAHQK